MPHAFRATSVLVLMFALALGLSTRASAAIVETDLNSDLEHNFDSNILTNDLINNGQPTLASYVATPGANFSAAGANDGTGIDTSGLTYYANPPSTGVDLLFTLGGSATGYDISNINGIYGWTDSRYRHAAQEWVVSVSTLSNPTLTPIHTVVYAPYAPNDNAAGSTQVTLTDPTGKIISGVTAINFHLSPYGSPGGPGYSGEIGVVREFDVTGVPTPAPEPAAVVLFGLGALGLLGVLGVARRRRRSA